MGTESAVEDRYFTHPRVGVCSRGFAEVRLTFLSWQLSSEQQQRSIISFS